MTGLVGRVLTPAPVAWATSSTTAQCLVNSLNSLLKGWQTYLRTDAEKAFNDLQNSRIPEPRRRPELKVAAPETAQARVSLEKLASEIATRRARVPEFQFIREEAQRRGLRVWLFGGTAAGYGHYVKWDVLRELGDARFQPNHSTSRECIHATRFPGASINNFHHARDAASKSARTQLRVTR